MAVTRSMNRRNWSEMPYEILVSIISLVNILDTMNNVAAVCHSWRLAASDVTMSNVLDTAEWRKKIEPLIPKEIINRQLQLVFVRGINLSCSHLTTLVLDPSFHVTDKHLQHASRRCLNLRTLELIFQNSVTNRWVNKALRSWENLECFHLLYDGLVFPACIFKTVGLYCLRLRVLKICCRSFTTKHMKIITKFMPRLTVLSVRCIYVELCLIEDFLSGIPGLEKIHLAALNIRDPPYNISKLNDLHLAINKARKIKGFPNLRVFHLCNGLDTCNSCLNPIMGDAPMNIPHLFPWRIARITFMVAD